ncbi:MAG: hypothetical protein ACFE9S_08575, partial [Candidatus Hermodarchaeota archaeon]
LGANLYSIFKTHFKDYITSVDKRIEFLYNYLFLLADYTSMDISVARASTLLRPRDDRYLTRLISPKKFKSPDAFFSFLVEVFKLTDNQRIFSSKAKKEGFRKEFIDFSFKYAKSAVFDNDHIPKKQFEALTYSLYAFNKLGRRENVNPNNPLGLYLLSHLSRDFSESSNEQMIRQQLSKGISTLQIFEIMSELRRNRIRQREVVDLTLKKCENYAFGLARDREQRRASIGTLVHKPLELLIYELLKSRFLIHDFETLLVHNRKFAADQAMKFDNNFRQSIDLNILKTIIRKNLQYFGSSSTVGEILKKIQHVIIDYTISSSKKALVGIQSKPGKVRKPYQSENRFLFIVNFDPKLNDPNKIDLYIKKIMKREKIHNPEMVQFIGINDFKKLFKIVGKFETELDNLLKDVSLAQKKMIGMKILMKRYNEASDELKEIQGTTGIGHNFIGDLI